MWAIHEVWTCSAQLIELESRLFLVEWATDSVHGVMLLTCINLGQNSIITVRAGLLEVRSYLRKPT